MRNKRSFGKGNDTLAKVDRGDEVFAHQALQLGALTKQLEEFFLNLRRPPDPHPEIGDFVKEAKIPGGNLEGDQWSAMLLTNERCNTQLAINTHT